MGYLSAMASIDPKIQSRLIRDLEPVVAKELNRMHFITAAANNIAIKAHQKFHFFG